MSETIRLGNAAKMRETLEWFWSKRSMLDFCHNNLSAKTWKDWDEVYYFLRELADKTQNALSAPTRNCDLYASFADAHEAWRKLDKRKSGPFDLWLFAEAKGESK